MQTFIKIGVEWESLFLVNRCFLLSISFIRVSFLITKLRTPDVKKQIREKKDEGFSLTTRQKEILRLVSLGHTNREIGEQLNISVRTVEVHRFNLMRRLRVRNVAQLLRQGLLLKLIPKSSFPK